MSAEDATLNGIDGARLAHLRERVGQDTTASTRTVAATATWVNGYQSAIRVRDLPALVADEPERMGGSNGGPTPGELMLAALSSCVVVGYALNAHLRGIPIRSLAVDVEADGNPACFLGCIDDGDSGYRAMRVRVRLDADADPEQVAALHQRVMRSSPVASTLAGQVAIEVTIEDSRPPDQAAS
ncbi:MAG: OsmC family protein [Chloroflexota bacterium]